jgi:hypothetical protein
MTARRLFLAVVAIAAAALVLAGIARPRLRDALARRAHAAPDSLAIADSALHRCGALAGPAKTRCYAPLLLSLVANGGVRLAMGTLGRLGALDRDVAFEGHQYAHAIGMSALDASPDVHRAFDACTEIYQSGCYHGVIQTYLTRQPHVGEAEVRALCTPYSAPGASRWLRFQCVHGMGHGLTMFYGHDLPRALAACDLLGEEWDRRSCYGGAFMENIVHITTPEDASDPMAAMPMMAEMPAHHGDHDAAPAFKAIDSTDLQYPCSVLGERYQIDCYQMQPAVVLEITGGNYARTFAACDVAPRAMRYYCYQGAGTSISGATMRDHAQSIRLCSLGRTAYQPWCYVGVVKNYIDVTAKPADGLSFCRELGAQANKLKCYEAVGQEIANLRSDSTDRAVLCAATDIDYRPVCAFGAQLTTTRPPGLPWEAP